MYKYSRDSCFRNFIVRLDFVGMYIDRYKTIMTINGYFKYLGTDSKKLAQ